MNPGIYYDISNEDYHAGDGVSKSQLDLVALSPALLQWQKMAPVDEEKTKALDMGTALHCLLLEPDDFERKPARQQATRLNLFWVIVRRLCYTLAQKGKA